MSFDFVNGRAGRWCGTRRTIPAAAFVVASLLATSAVAGEGAAPDFRATTTAGDTLQLSSFRGRAVIVDFWATWCTPCRDQLRNLAALEREMPEVVVLAVNLDTRRDKLRSYLDRVEAPRRVLLDPQGRIANAYAIAAMPWTVLVDPHGAVVSARAGGSAATIAQLRVELRQLAARRRPDAATKASMGPGN